ncbi:Intradiol ring-cleavage dioxygenase [Zopfochytrium polystomum]|nr:Intradiol ring-cleavage dioxygenase [Zopfochytrium polystomum]
MLFPRNTQLAVLLVALLSLASRPAAAHPGHDDDHDEHAHDAGDEAVALFRREQALARREAAAACHASLTARDEATHARLARRALSLGTDPSTLAPALARRASCVVDPETTGGPYYINGLIQRSNMTENQPGVALVLDVSVVDIASCSPLVDAAVEFWSCNATGYYSGFTGISPSTNQQVGSCVNGGTSSGSGPGASGCLTDELTFLRGFVLTDDNGVAEMTTIFPGFYNGRTPHIHVTVHTGGSVGSDGTYVGGEFRHIGQLFPGDEAATSVYSIASLPYYSLGTDFIKLADDQVASKEGYSGYGILSLTNMGSTIAQGMIGAVTIYVDSTATQKDPVASDFVWLHLAAIVLAIALAF